MVSSTFITRKTPPSCFTLCRSCSVERGEHCADCPSQTTCNQRSFCSAIFYDTSSCSRSLSLSFENDFILLNETFGETWEGPASKCLPNRWTPMRIFEEVQPLDLLISKNRFHLSAGESNETLLRQISRRFLGDINHSPSELILRKIGGCQWWSSSCSFSCSELENFCLFDIIMHLGAFLEQRPNKKFVFV